MTTIAFLGLGNMGGPMAANLVSAGHTVNGFDPVPALKEAAQAHGATVFDSGAAAAAEADVVITSLPNGEIVKAAYAEILPVAKDGALLIDTSTISVDDARDIHAQAAERGLATLRTKAFHHVPDLPRNSRFSAFRLFCPCPGGRIPCVR